MKKIIRFFVFTTIIFVGFSCSKQKVQTGKVWSGKSSKVKVLSTTPMIDYLVGAIAQDHVFHQALITGDLDPHSYELVKGDRDKIYYADIIFYNGLDLEHGASVKNCLKKHKNSVSVAEELSKNSLVEFIKVDGQLDPHIWMDVKLFSFAIDPIVRKLSELDKDHKAEFEENGKKLLAKMLAVDYLIKKSMQKIPLEKRKLVTTHDAFYYFSRAYLADDKEDYLTRVASPEGLAPDGQMSISDIKEIINFSLQNDIDVLFAESNLSQDALKKVILSLKRKRKRAKIASEHLYGDAIGHKGSGADDYLKMMLHNAKTIESNLRQENDTKK